MLRKVSVLLIGIITFQLLVSAPLSAERSGEISRDTSDVGAKVRACWGTGDDAKAYYKDKTDPKKGIICEGTAGGTLEGFFKSVINILLFITGMVAVLFIVIGGLR